MGGRPRGLGKVKGSGRQVGTPDKRRIGRQSLRATEGVLPLDFMLETMRDTTRDHKDRMAAAIAAAPYLHPRLANIETNVSGALTVEIVKFAHPVA